MCASLHSIFFWGGGVCKGLGLECSFGMLTQHLQGCQFHNTDELKIAIHEWVQISEPDFCSEKTFQLVPMETLSQDQ